MKKLLNLKWIALFAIMTANAQQEKGIIGSSNWLNNWTDFKPSKTEYNEATEILYGKITANKTLQKRNTYLLQGPVYVAAGVTLTIEPGTVIKGDSETNGALVISKGARLEANGTETDPIVFTSNKPVKKPGDWGGVVILNDAPINKFGGVASMNYDLDPAQTIYGGTNPMANSGVLRFLRIEFAGKKIKGFKNYNALTLAGVGNKTLIEHVMTSFSAGNGIEVLGGDTNLKNMVTLRVSGDDFKFNQGAQVKLDNSLVIRHSLYSGASRTRCINVVGYDKKEEADFSKPSTNVVATNCTLVNNSESFDLDLASGLVKEGVFVGANTSLSLKRSLISGFAPATILDAEINPEAGGLKKIGFSEVFFNNCKGNIFLANSSNNDDLEDFYGNPQFLNLYEKTPNAELFINPVESKSPDFRLKVGKFTAGK
ncbi:hypothetical protein HUE46_07355 [Flavobacterium columnare]|nr:hypothetical protein [Flavobacterium columnare]ANO46981.1 hypothetical protein Pf1_01524 [Flavobacterium columnare]APT22311.1 hypothetical protein BU993_06515 [Flavobacterium columnare]MBF6653838.1 hypothetical protein [Flavobacterium columnare]MBF6656551.1 hypothetical protein [Flavobacterium columnare]MBF6659218.1 hypothetical protein [Flavobacterium columnare]